MELTEAQIEVLRKRKKEIEMHKFVGMVLVVIFAILTVIDGFSLLTLIFLITLIITGISFGTERKELSEIEFKLAGEKR